MIALTLNTVAVLALRGISFYLRLQDQRNAAADVDAIADAAVDGRVTDAHMLEVANSIKTGNAADFADIRKRIEAHSASFQARIPSDSPEWPGSQPVDR